MDNLNLGLCINLKIFLKSIKIIGIITNKPSNNNIGPTEVDITIFSGPNMDVEMFWNK